MGIIPKPKDSRMLHYGGRKPRILQPATFRFDTEAESLEFATPQDLSGVTGSYMPLSGGTFTGDVTLADSVDIIVNTSTGTKIGTATSQKIGLFNATPVVQGTTISDPTGGGTQDAEARTAINALIDRLQAIGIIA